jgi:NAD-dependent DNA ligase
MTNQTHGLQFQARHLRVVPPSTLEGIEKYLGSGMVKGIGPHFAKMLVTAFGEQVFDAIEYTPDRLTELEGIGAKRKARVTSAWAEQKVVREIMVFLQSHGSAPPGPCASTQPMGIRRSRWFVKILIVWPWIFTAWASKRPISSLNGSVSLRNPSSSPVPGCTICCKSIP